MAFVGFAAKPARQIVVGRFRFRACQVLVLFLIVPACGCQSEPARRQYVTDG